jgi:hypothetical protein
MWCKGEDDLLLPPPSHSPFSCQCSAIMAALPATIQTFSTFHSSTTALPAEISLGIISHASPNMLVLPMGGGVGMRRAHHPIASVSRVLRQLYLSQPYPAREDERAMAPVRCSIGNALHFDDLQTVASFFQGYSLRRVVCIVIAYLDDQSVGWWPGTKDYAYEALSFSTSTSTSCRCLGFGFTFPALTRYPLWMIRGCGWSLLKIRNLARFDILGPHRCIAPNVREYLKGRAQQKTLPVAATRRGESRASQVARSRQA